MDFLEEDAVDLDLPTVTDINRDLFTGEVESANDATNSCESFDVDEFLIKNNFQYMPLEDLIKDLSDLSQDMIHILLDNITSKYEDCLKFCEPYIDHDNESALELQKSKTDVNNFIFQLEALTHKDLERTRQVISDTVEYLRKLDEISEQLHDQTRIPDMLVLAKQLSRSLHLMCGAESLEQTLCTELTIQLHSLVARIGKLLTGLYAIDSPYVHHLCNEYHGLLQEFQISLKILSDKCLGNPEQHKDLSRALVSTLYSQPSEHST